MASNTTSSIANSVDGNEISSSPSSISPPLLPPTSNPNINISQSNLNQTSVVKREVQDETWIYDHKIPPQTPLFHTHDILQPQHTNYGSHAPGIRKAMQILKVQFGNLASSSSSSVVNNNDVINDNKINVVGVHHSVSTVDDDTIDNTNKKNKKKEKNVDDGRIHSLPHRKYGPYTCPKCSATFDTSQKFASHALTNHHNKETEEEKKKRYMLRIRNKPDLRIQMLNDGFTFVPTEVSSAQPRAPAVSYDHQVAPRLSPPSPPVGVKVKLEPSDT